MTSYRTRPGGYRRKCGSQPSRDRQALADTLEGECDLREQIIRVLREARVAEAMAEGLKELIAEFQAPTPICLTFARPPRLLNYGFKLRQH